MTRRRGASILPGTRQVTHEGRSPSARLQSPLMPRIVAISGSLRHASSNSALLRALARVAPPEVEVLVYDVIGDLPHFNPDLDEEGAAAPPAVEGLRTLLIGADAIVISTPEYAHGVPGSLKNMLDWVVSTGELVDKPIASLNASPVGGEFAQQSLLETLRTMNWRVIEIAPFVKAKIRGEVTDEGTLDALRQVIRVLLESHPRTPPRSS